MGKVNRNFYTWHDHDYKQFMLNVLFSLEPRFFSKNEMLYDEMVSVDELMFLHNGKVGIGFRVNQQIKFCMTQTDNCVVGTYGMIFNRRTEFVY
jgi:hypothetical protein